jgi:glycerate 2-kinase
LDDVKFLGRLEATLNSTTIHDKALHIWQSGVDAVKPARLIRDKISVVGSQLQVEDSQLDLSQTRRLLVVGAGKASAAMAIAFQKQIGTQLQKRLPELRISGWINCPENSFPRNEIDSKIRLFEARPAGVNEPTEKSIRGTEQILQMVSNCAQDDLVICLLSGGGSALLTAPVEGLRLEDKQAVARQVSSAGGNIEQLNTVRRALSRVKAGGLAAACKAGRMLTLVISDVLGDSLETIASGPTCMEQPASPSNALRVLKDLGIDKKPELSRVVLTLESRLNRFRPLDFQPTCKVQHFILGSNLDAVNQSKLEAERMGFKCIAKSATSSEGDVLLVADELLREIQSSLSSSNGAAVCHISGGEPTVALPPNPGRGGRNQQLALALLQRLLNAGWLERSTRELVFLSGGTDGEDGPTDAAGAWFNRQLAEQAAELGLDPSDFLRRADPYRFFEPLGGLLQVGPTGTNVCDLRIAAIA